MYYSEHDARAATVSKVQALKEISLHSGSADEFLAEVGDKPSYTGEEVLNWLGY